MKLKTLMETNTRILETLPATLARQARRKQLNATCIHCERDVLNQLCQAAGNWAGYGPPASRIFQCPHCEEELEFALGWTTVLCWAMPMVEELTP